MCEVVGLLPVLSFLCPALSLSATHLWSSPSTYPSPSLWRICANVQSSFLQENPGKKGRSAMTRETAEHGRREQEHQIRRVGEAEVREKRGGEYWQKPATRSGRRSQCLILVWPDGTVAGTHVLAERPG